MSAKGDICGLPSGRLSAPPAVKGLIVKYADIIQIRLIIFWTSQSK